MKRSKLFASSLLFGLVTFSNGCEDPDDLPIGIKTQDCPEGQYDGGDRCVARVKAQVPEGAALRNAAFANRETALEDFISNYQLTDGYTVSGVDCVEEVEGDTTFKSGFYDGHVSLNCEFTVDDADPATEPVLALEYDLAKDYDAEEGVTDEQRAELRSDVASFLKVIQDPQTDAVRVFLCSVSQVALPVGAAEGSYNATPTEGDNLRKENVVSSCEPFGLTSAQPAVIPATAPDSLKAMPYSIAQYAKAPRDVNNVTDDDTSLLEYVIALDLGTGQKVLGLTCGGTNHDLTVTFKPEADNPVSGTVTVDAMASAESFFTLDDVNDAANADKLYKRSRELLGCPSEDEELGGTVECLNAGTLSYKVFGNLITLERISKDSRNRDVNRGKDVWTYDGTNFVYGPQDGGEPTACEIIYTQADRA